MLYVDGSWTYAIYAPFWECMWSESPLSVYAEKIIY